MRSAAKKQPAGHYVLACPVCGGQYEDSQDEFLLTCPQNHPPALLRAIYRVKQLVAHPEHGGVFRFFDWLPIRRRLRGAAGPAVFLSKGLGHRLGLDRLMVVFSGYWPEREAFMESCTFKELEAQAVCGRASRRRRRRLVVSSAGNTGRAFLQACERYEVPALVVVPGASMPMLWSTRELGSSVRLAVLEGEADYSDAIELGNGIAGTEGYYPEGGARNTARRDGMGTALLCAVERAGAIPGHYFQAVGSGTGAIAAWEMNLRLLEDGRFGSHKMQLHLGQNAPFTPMTDAWEVGSRLLATPTPAESREKFRALRAPVLGNRMPPYSIAGGLFDALSDTRGQMYRVTNAEAEAAGRLFEETEGCDLDPAAEVAVASLQQAVARGRIGRDELVVLNITGGGRRRLEREKRLTPVRADARFHLDDLRGDGSLGLLRRLREAMG